MKIIDDKGLLGIDKAEIDELIAARKFIGLNRTPRREELIVSLTSYDKRIHDVKYTIYSLLNQTLPPDRVILWLDEDSFPQREKNLPRDLLELKNFGLTIDWCENLFSYKKLLPAMVKYPDAIIATTDDDIFYQPDWLKILYDEHLKHPDCIIAHRCRQLKLNERGNFLPYRMWPTEIKFSAPLYKNFFTGAGGVLYSKKFFHQDVLRRDIFTELAPMADDIWFWVMSVLNGTKIKVPIDAQPELIYVDIAAQRSDETLLSKNNINSNAQFQKVLEKYPACFDALVREAAETTPHFSVVLFLREDDNLDDFIKVASKQKFLDFEVIVLNSGTRVEISDAPTNFKIVNYPGGNMEDAFNIGLQRATGEYILFQDMNSTLAYNALDVIAKFTVNFGADVVHFTGHVSGGKFVRDGSLRLENDSPVLFSDSKQNRALLWLQDQLSERLETKIFKREFLLANKINFDGDLMEFMFRALIYAEKYLLVPRAFCLCKE